MDVDTGIWTAAATGRGWVAVCTESKYKPFFHARSQIFLQKNDEEKIEMFLNFGGLNNPSIVFRTIAVSEGDKLSLVTGEITQPLVEITFAVRMRTATAKPKLKNRDDSD